MASVSLPDPAEDDERRRQLHAKLNRNILHYPPSDLAIRAHQQVRREVDRLGHLLVEICPPTEELERALTMLTDGVMAGANAAIARNHDRLTQPDDGDEWAYD